MKRSVFGRRAVLAVCGIGTASLLAASADAASRESTPPVRQPRIVQIVPDADGLPWQMEIRPSVTVAQSDDDEITAEEIPAIPEDRVSDEPEKATTPAIQPKPRKKAAKRPAKQPATKRPTQQQSTGQQQQSRPVQAMPDAFIGDPDQLPEQRSVTPQSKPVPPPADPGDLSTPSAPIPSEPVQAEPVGPAPQSMMPSAAAEMLPPARAIGAAYREAYRAIPFDPRLEAARPGYRHELAVLLLTGKQLPPVSTPQRHPVAAPGGLGVPPSGFAPYRPYLPAQYDYYQAQPSQFRLLTPGLFAPGFNGTINSPFVSPLGFGY